MEDPVINHKQLAGILAALVMYALFIGLALLLRPHV